MPAGSCVGVDNGLDAAMRGPERPPLDVASSRLGRLLKEVLKDWANLVGARRSSNGSVRVR